MQGIEVKKTYASDFEKIYPLLQDFNSPYSRADWFQIFSYQWDEAKDYVGYHLEYQNDVIGFMGLIFSCRNKQNRNYKLCNITSLIVKEKYRSATLLLVRKLKQYEDVIFTGMRPIEESYRLLTIMGFTHLENNYKVIPTINGLLSKNCKNNRYELPDLLEKLESENKRIAMDHMKRKCKMVLFDFEGAHCLLIYQITQQNYYKMPLKKVHLLHISHLESFNKNIHAILKFFKARLGLLSALYVDSRFLHSPQTYFSIKKEINPPRIWSGRDHHQIEIDELYSETVLL